MGMAVVSVTVVSVTVVCVTVVCVTVVCVTHDTAAGPGAGGVARPALPPRAGTPRAERTRGAGLRRRGRLLLHLLLLPRGCAVSVGGRGRPAAPALAPPLAPRRGHRPDVGAQGHAAGEAAR